MAAALAGFLAVLGAPPGYPKGARLNYSMGWLGNTYSGGICNDTQRVGADCHVRANAQWTFTEPTTGVTYGNTVWDEAGGIAQAVAANGSIIGAPPAESFGRPGASTAVVAASARYLFLGLNGNLGTAANHNVSGVFRFFADPDRWANATASVAPWPGGAGSTGNCLNLTRGTATRSGYDAANFAVTGLGVCGSTLLVADNLTGTVRAYDAETMAPGASWSCVPHTGPYNPTQHACGEVTFACGDAGSVHALVGRPTGPRQVELFKWDGQGNVLVNGEKQWLHAARIAWDNASQSLLLVDNDASAMNVQIYSSKGKALAKVAEFGVGNGGAFSFDASGGPGSMGDFRFYGISGLGIDSAGAIVVNNGLNSHTDMRRFELEPNATRPSKPSDWPAAVGRYKLAWQLVNNIFQQVADVSRLNESCVFTTDSRYDVDWTKPMDEPGSGFWRLAAVTTDPARYPDDPRSCGYAGNKNPAFLCEKLPTVWARQLMDQATQRQREVLFMTGVGRHLAVYRLDGEIGVPCMVQGTSPDNDAGKRAWWEARGAPAKGRWAWTDGDGGGGMSRDEFVEFGEELFDYVAHVDERGDIWRRVPTQAGFYLTRYAFRQEFTPFGCPVYDVAPWSDRVPPEPFNSSYAAGRAGKGPGAQSGRVMHQTDAQTGTGTGHSSAATGNDEFNRRGDRLWVSDYTPESPEACPTAGTAGSLVCAYRPWLEFNNYQNKEPNTTADLCIQLPNWRNSTSHPLSTWSNCTHSMAVAGNCVFAGMLADPETPGGGLINVYNATSSEHLGALDPGSESPRIGGAGWTDLAYGVNPFFRNDGAVVVLEEEVFFEKVVAYVIPPGWC